uniref:Pentapeptide repeat-containing protein n=1 Tax=Candidatus Kentrum eta TaxID=2126337 RepID=A0A450UL49_9GAMM|nr:MAG: Pentapeptide repeat-containing protein [Candidatus Kentron sp. H]VFJ93200.1 MAG: Pentapeptide repeat-containing protein [Candidatus Kentron sp. H]VFK00038.1 MAG: Pentapeptide repeat-containing protein [Candidatus Kentron sp. H]
MRSTRNLTMTDDYSHQRLRGRDFRGRNLRGARFRDADLTGADFTGARLGKTVRGRVATVFLSLILGLLGGGWRGLAVSF